MKDDDSPVLYNRAMILGNLFMLVKHECLITAFLGKKKLLLTSILDVDPKNNTIILDTSIVESLNQKLLTTPRVKFCTVFNGVHVAFSGESISRATHGQYDVFVLPIPRSLYWFNRREAYRVKTIEEEDSFCKLALFPFDYISSEITKPYHQIALNKIKLQLAEQIEQDLIQEENGFLISLSKMTDDDAAKAKIQRKNLEKERAENPVLPDENLFNIIRLCLFDISMTGCALINVDEEFSYFLKIGSRFNDCIITMPNHGEINISLEIVAKRDLNELNQFNELVCLKFIEPEPTAESVIFRYIQALDRYHKHYSFEDLLSSD
jgi:c-di-GMP-binding flagellar brake protein YcgR